MSSEQIATQRLTEGLAALDAAEFDDAIELFGSAAVEDPSRAEAWFYLGLCYLETRELENCVESLNRAIAADSNYADAHYLLGTARGASGDYDGAAACYRHALLLNPKHFKAEEFLIRTEALLASREHFRTAVRLIHGEPREADWLNKAVRELLHSVTVFNESPAKGEIPKIGNQLLASKETRAIIFDPNDLGPFWARAVKQGEAAFAIGNWPGAAASYHEALDLSDEHAFIHHALGLTYFGLGDVDGGVKAWQHTLDLDPDFDFSSRCILEQE